MSALCSIHDNRILHLNSIVCVHHVAVSGEAVNSNNAAALRIKFRFMYLHYSTCRTIMIAKWQE